MKRVVLYYYAFGFFFSLLFWVPIFYEYQKMIGLNDTEIFAIQSAYYIAFALMEIPTGMIADRLGYRLSMRAGAIVLVSANLLPIYMQNYNGFYAHFMLISLSRSLISGASSAYLYDFLQLKGAAIEYKKFEGRARSYALIGRIICWAAVGWLMAWHFTLPYWLTVAAATVSVILAFSMPAIKEHTAVDLNQPRQQLVDRLRDIFLTLRKTPVLTLVMLQGTAVFILVRIVQVNLFQPILGAKNFQVTQYGMVMALMTIFEAVGSAQFKGLAKLYPARFAKYNTDTNLVALFSLIMGASVLIIPYVDKIGAIASLILFSFAAGFIFPIQRQLMNDQITKPQYRATLLSIESIIDRSICAVVAWALGVYIATGRLNEFLLQSGIATFVLIIVLFFAFKFVRKSEVRP